MSGGGHPTTASHPAHSLTSPKPAPMVTIFIWLLLVMMMMMVMIMMIMIFCKGAVGPPASVNSSRKATKPHKPDGGQGSQYFTVQVGTILLLLLLLLPLLHIIILILIIIINGNKVSTAKQPPELSILHSAGPNCLCTVVSAVVVSSL